MPKYKVNGRTFNIPDNEVDLFEADFPEAQLHYQTNDGRKFTIYANERKDFLSDFPDATELGWSETIKEQAKQADPFQPEDNLAQPMFGSMSYQDNIGKPEAYNYYPSPLSEEGRADYEPISAEERSKQEYDMLMRQLEEFNAANGSMMDTYEAYEKAAKFQVNDGGFAVDTPERRYLDENSDTYHQRKMEKDELNDRIKNNSYFNQMRMAEADAANETVDAISNLMAQNEAENPKMKHRLRAKTAMAMNPRGSIGLSTLKDDEELKEYGDTMADLATAKRLYENTAQVYAAPINDGEDIFKKFGQGFGQRFDDADFWSMGIIGIADDINARAAFQKIQDKFGSVKEFANLTDTEIDALLTPSEQLLISAVMDNNAALYARKDNTAGAYEAGAGAADSLMFMAQFLLTGGIGDAATVGTAAHKRLVSWLGRKVGTMSNGLMKDVARGAVKLGVGTAESIGKALVMTPLMPHTYANIADKMMSFDDNGELMDTTDAIISGSIDALIETWSESTGDFVNKVLGVPGDITKGLAKKVLKNVDFSDWGRAMNAPLMKLLKQGGFNGFLGEMGEEFIGNATRSLVGTLAPGSGQDPEALKNFAQWEQLLVTAGSFAPMTIFGIGTSSAQYGLAKRKLNNAQKAFESMLREASYTEDQTRFIIDELLGSTDAHLTPERLVANFSPLLRELAFNDRFANNRTQAMQSAVDFMWQIARYRTFDGVYHRQEEQQRNDMLAEIQEGTGREFWTTRLSENAGLDGTAYETDEVRAVEFNDGRVAYVLGGDGVNNTVVYNDGQTGFLSEEQLNEGKANGSIVSDATMGLNDYLTQQVARVRMTEEEQRMFAERNSNIGAIRAQFPQDATVELGTTEAPVQGIVRQQTPNGVIVENPAGISQLTWEELGRTVGIEVNPQTDAQMEEEAINNLEIADLQRRREREQRRAQRNTAAEAALAEEQMLDEAENEGLEKPIPMKADGTVDQTTFWNESPARWAQWKTEQRQDGGAYASSYIQNAIGILEGQIAENEAAFLAESDFDAKDALEQAINQQRARLAELQDLAMQYMPSVIPTDTSAEATAEQTQPSEETTQPAAVMADRQKFELDAEYQRRLSLAKALAEKEMILKEYFEAISAGSMEAVVMNKQNYKQIMKENGCDEAAIEEVTNAIKEAEEEHTAVDALHANDKIFVIAEYNYTIENGRVSYVHERQHNITKRNTDLIQRVLSLGLSRETLQKIVRTLSGTTFYDKKSDEVLADEILSSTMEIAYTFDDFSVTLSKLGLPIELINLINQINDEQRNDFTLANARRNTLPRNDRQGSSRQDVGDQGEVSGGILGEEGDGSQETGLRGTESGEPTTGGTEASEEGLQVPMAEVEEESEEEANGPDFRVTKPEDNLSDETKKELADKGLVMDGGAIMSEDYAELKHELGYETPIERNTDLDDLRFSYGTRHAHIANYLQHPEAEQRVVDLLERLAERLSMNELVFGVISKATKHTYGKKLPGSVAGPLRSNVEYVITFDLDTSCPRTFQYLNLVKRIERRIGRPLTQTECIQLIEMMRMYGQQIPCVYCYAENKRQALKQYYTDFIEARHGVLSAATDEEALEHMYGHTKEQSNDPKVALTDAAYNVFVEWRKNPKGMYNPTIKMLWYQYTNDRNSILSLLDTMLEDKGISIDATDAKIAASVAAEFGVTNAKAIKVIEEIVAEWKWDVIEGKDHDQYTPMDEDDWGVNERALEVWRDMTAYAKSASSAKSVIRYTPYTDELKEISQEDKDYINGMGGVRMHSSNDFRIDYVFDYFQFMADMALYKMFGHTYTKSPEFVRIFGNSGYKINMSIAAYQDENGKIRPNADEGFDWEEAKTLRQLFPNAGTMLMATSDEQIQMALDSDWIDMCIPFHHSGLPKAVWYNMRMWQDYTSIQKELFLNSSEMKEALKADGVIIPKKAKADEIANLYNEHFNVKVIYDKKGKRIRPHFLPGPTVVDGNTIPGHNNDHQRYLDLCREYGVKPRFAGMQVRDNSPEGGGRVIDVTEHPRYMIFIKETARTDSPQTAIQFNFDEASEALGGKTPMEYAFDELEARAMAESELEGSPVKDIYNSLNKDQFGIADKFVSSIIKHKEQTGEDYPLDYLTPESREWFLVQRKALEEAFKDVETIPYHRNEYDEQGNLTQGEGLEREDVIDLVEEARKADLRHRVVAEGTLVPGHKKGQPMLSDAEMMADVSFRITKNTKATIETWFNKAGIDDELTQSTINYLDSAFKDATEQLCAAKWYLGGKINLPGEDDYKVRDAVKVAKKNKVDALLYDSPMDIIYQFGKPNEKQKPINPDNVPTLKNRTEVPGTDIVIYDVEESEESRENMREIINTHYGKNASPWCLLQGNEFGQLTPEAKERWEYYNAYPKQVAFKGGRLLAFSANSAKNVAWWDRLDKPFEGVPVMEKLNDAQNRRATSVINPKTGKQIRIADVHQRIEKDGYTIIKNWDGIDGPMLNAQKRKNEALIAQFNRYTKEDFATNLQYWFAGRPNGIDQVYTQEKTISFSPNGELETYSVEGYRLSYNRFGNATWLITTRTPVIQEYGFNRKGKLVSFFSGTELITNRKRLAEVEVPDEYKALVGRNPKSFMAEAEQLIIEAGLAEAYEESSVSFRITPEQDKAYMDAVEVGDMETAQRMVLEAAKLAIPNTKVVDENGNPKIVYHGTQSKFTAFDVAYKGKNFGYRLADGFYFSPDKTVSESYASFPDDSKEGEIKAVFLNVIMPLYIESAKDYRKQIKEIAASLSNGNRYKEDLILRKEESEILSEEGYDGIIEKRTDYIKGEIVVFSPSQIKSADPVTYDDAGNVIPLSERFNPEKDDIRFRTVYHGTAAKFEKFDHAHMGEGEGAQAYGWGTYVTEVPGIGKTYAIAMRDKRTTDTQRENAIVNKLAADILNAANGNRQEALNYLYGLLQESWSDKKRVKKEIKIITTGRNLPEGKAKSYLYTVEIPDNGIYIQYEQQMDSQEEIIDSVIPALEKDGWQKVDNTLLEKEDKKIVINTHATGGDFYAELSYALGSDANASHFLKRAGIIGISYPAQNMSGGREDAKRNFVIFDEEDLEIVETVRFRMRRENESAMEFYQSVVDEHLRKYNDIAAMEVFPVDEATAKRFGYTLDQLKKFSGLYDSSEDLIAIFAKEEETDSIEVEDTIFHESVHKLVDFFDYLKEVGEWMWSVADKYKVFADIKKHIEQEYSESEYAEEMMCFMLGGVMPRGLADGLLYGMPEHIRKQCEQIFNEIGYDSTRESIARLLGPDGKPAMVSSVASEASGEDEGRRRSEKEQGGSVRFRITEITPEVQEELDAIKASAIVMGNFMKAPNGQPTNLTEQQWLMVRTKNFKSWFGDWENDPENASKVVDENGEPMVMHHGSAWEPLMEPKGKAVFRMNDGLLGKGAYFSNELAEATLYAEIATGLDTTEEGNYELLQDKYVTDYFLNVRNEDDLFREGNDMVAVAKSPSQIKSATDNNGQFSEKNDDIRFRMTDSKGNTLTPAQEEFFANSKAVDKDGNLLVLYHGTPRAGFTEFESGWFTTSKEDAISYSGDRKGRMFDPNEKYEPETLVAGDFPLGYMTFDSEEDRAEFLAEYPEAESAMSEAEFDSMMLQADEEYDDLIARKPELQKIWNAYREYERERFVDTTIGDIISNPEAYTEEDLMRAMLAYDSNASLDSLDDMDAAERKDALVSALQNANEETEGGILDMVVPTRVPRNGEGVKHNDLGNRTYEVYANVENPYEIDANGRGSEFESGDIYKSVEEALADEQYDGVIIRNWRVGRTQQLGDVVVPKNGSQIKLTINENPTELDDIRFSIRTKPAPKKTGKGYKVFYLKDGKLYPPMVANLGGVDTPVGVWLDAEEGTRAGVSKTGRPQVKQGGKGTQGGSGTLAYRPGWHLGEIPYAIQFNRKDENGDRTLFPADFVWAEVEYANDVDYQEEAMSYGMNANGKFQHSLAGLPKLPTDGSYRYRTNPNPETDPWIITGAMKVNRLLTPSEVDQMVIDAGREPQKRQEGAVTDAQIEELNKELGLVEEEEEVSIRTTGTPTEDIVAEGVSLSPAQLASLAGDIFAALPEESRKKITDGLNGNILGLQDAILQIPTSLATKEDWNDEDRQMAEVVAEQMTKAVGIEMTRPFSASEALWTLYNAVNKSTDLVSEASRALVRRNLGFDSQTLEMEKEAKDGVRFRTVGNASANAQASMYNRGAANVWTRLKESYVDMHASVEELVKAIEKRSGKVAQGFENILMALNQQSSKGLAAMEAYEQKFLNKMFDAIRKIMDKTDFKYEDIVRYVILKHGLERNVKMAQRDAKAHYQEIYDDIIAKIKGMNPAQKRTYLTNAQLRDADAKAELARLQAVNTSILTPDQLTDYKKEIAKAKKEAADAAEHLVRAQKIATMTEQDAQDELDKIFDNITNESDSVYQEMRKNDYSGISSMFYDTLGVDRKNFATEEEYQSALMQAKADKYDNLGDIEGAAQMEVTLFEKAVNTDNLWKRINAATKETLRQQYDANMISKDQYLNLRDMFEYYVPLRGFADNTAEDMYTYYRRPNSTGYTKPILGAEGRKTEAESPFGWIAAMAGSAIASNVKNEAKLALYYFVANRPDNGIATLSKTWFVHTPGDVDANGKKIFRPAYPPFNEDLSSASAKADYEIWQANMKNLQAQGLAYEAGQRLNLGNSVVNISDTNKPEHIVNVKVGGKDYTIVINGNPRAAQAINGDLNIESSAQDYSALFGPVLRWMSSVNTSYNPEFWITNMMRDMAFTMMAVNIKEDPAYRRKFFKNYAKAFKVISMVAKNEKGTLGNKYIENMYKDFVKYGGVTGYTQIKDSETWEKEIENYLASNDPASIRSGKAMRGMKTVFHAAHRFGESLEQVSRFAAFLTAVETGKSINEAINDAKEITVNFNRKGSGKMITLEEAKYLTDNNGQPLNKFEQWAAVGLSSIAPLGRRFIMFFNAAIQGLNATYKLYAKNKTRAIGWALGYAAVGMMNAVLHAMLDDDDDYLDIPQYERRNSLMIGGNGAYFKWALPQEARAFYALGDLAVESVMGRNPHQSVIGEALKISTEILPVNPSKGWKAFMPSVAIPLVELALNEDYKGAPIYNEQKWLTEEEKKRSTKWSKAYSGTGDMYIGIAKVLNAISGGDEHDAGLINIQPEKMEHIVQSAFGGTIRTADKFINTIMAAFDPEEDVTVRQFPFLNRFLTINDERFKNVHVNDVYDYYAAEAEHTISLQKKYTKDRNADALKDLRSSDEYKWARIYSKYKKPIKKYQEAIRAADTTNERMELMKQQDELKRKMIKEISEL